MEEKYCYLKLNNGIDIIGKELHRTYNSILLEKPVNFSDLSKLTLFNTYGKDGKVIFIKQNIYFDDDVTDENINKYKTFIESLNKKPNKGS